ncbi:MAG: DUF1461 domain-containing protein [Candidatus Woesearchaeota archaeon]
MINNKVNKEKNILLMVLTFVFVILSFVNLLLLNFFIIYYSEFRSSSKSGNDLTKNVFYFLEGKEELSSAFSWREASHLLDVKNLISKTKLFFSSTIFLWALILAFTMRLKNFNTEDFTKYFLVFLASLTFIALIFLLCVKTNFDYAFSVFHSIFFKPKTWIFDYNSLIIQLFPKNYFFNLSSKMLVGLILELFFINILFVLKSFCFKKKTF